jgi:hypothetical protein
LDTQVLNHSEIITRFPCKSQYQKGSSLEGGKIKKAPAINADAFKFAWKFCSLGIDGYFSDQCVAYLMEHVRR